MLLAKVARMMERLTMQHLQHAEALEDLARYLDGQSGIDENLRVAMETGINGDSDTGAIMVLELYAENEDFEARMGVLVTHGTKGSNDWARKSALREAFRVLKGIMTKGKVVNA